MARAGYWKIHHTWEDWLGICLGVAVVVSPLLASETATDLVLLNLVFVGLVIVALAALELVDLHRWEEGLMFALGGWLAASPAILDYAGSGGLRSWHVGLGILIMLLAAFEYWQDRRLSPSDLSKHGS